MRGKKFYNLRVFLGMKDKLLRNGKILRKYLVKFKNYPFKDARWMVESQLKDSMAILHSYIKDIEL